MTLRSVTFLVHRCMVTAKLSEAVKWRLSYKETMLMNNAHEYTLSDWPLRTFRNNSKKCPPETHLIWINNDYIDYIYCLEEKQLKEHSGYGSYYSGVDRLRAGFTKQWVRVYSGVNHIYSRVTSCSVSPTFYSSVIAYTRVNLWVNLHRENPSGKLRSKLSFQYACTSDVLLWLDYCKWWYLKMVLAVIRNSIL